MLFYGRGDPWVYAVSLLIFLLIALGYRRTGILLLYIPYLILALGTGIVWFPISIVMYMLGAYEGYTWWEVLTKPFKGDPQ